MSDSDQREEAVFEAALQLRTTERAAYLDQACAGDPQLRQRVEALLGALERAGNLLSEPAVTRTAATVGLSQPPTGNPGDRIGRYKLLQQIGEGGCGVVYMAEQEEPVRRRVALKVIKLGMDTKQVIARFEAERQALALMDHPNIAKIFDAGVTGSPVAAGILPAVEPGFQPGGRSVGSPGGVEESEAVTGSEASPGGKMPPATAGETPAATLSPGRPYFVMELVRGTRITDFCDENNLPMPQRLQLFIQVCSAIQHAHQKGIIHRDIKPSNILVTVNDGIPVPKVIDFGIAKATTGQQLTDKTLFTAFEQFIGTPAYMSPEQAVMTSLDIDTRSDIYSLGVLLYELLTGKTPFDTRELLQAGFDEMRRTIREKEPARPSTRLSTMVEGELTTAAKHRHTDAPKLLHLVRGDLDWIVMKCLDKDRARRYETANGLARDLERHLNCEPVVARPPSRLYEFQKTVRRHKFGFAAGAALIFVLTLGVLASTRQALRAMRAEREQSRQRERAEQSAQEARLAQSETTSNLWNSYLLQARANRFSGRPGRRFDSLEALAKAAAIRKSPELRDEAIANLAQTDLKVAAVWEVGSERGNNETFDPSFTLSAVIAKPDLIAVRRVWSRELVAEIHAPRGSVVWVRKFSSDLRYLALTTSLDGTCVWDFSRESFVLSGLTKNAVGDFGSDNQAFAIGNQDGSISLFDLATGKELRRFGNEVPEKGVAFDSSGARLACWNDDRLEIRDAATGDLECQFEPQGFYRSAAWSADGQLLAAAGPDYRTYLWQAETGRLVQLLLGRTEGALGVAISPSGEFLATSSFDLSTRVWESLTGRALASLPGETWNLAFSADGRHLGPVRHGASNHIFEIVRPTCFQRLAPLVQEIGSQKVHAVDFSPDGRLVVAAAADGVRVWDLFTGHFLTRVPTPGASSALFDPEGHALLISAAGELSRWPLRHQQGRGTNEMFIGPGQPLGQGGGWAMAQLHSRNRTLAVASSMHAGAILNLRMPTNWLWLEKVHTNATYIDTSPDGRFAATGTWGGSGVWIWDARTGALLHQHPTDGHAAVAFSPDGRWLVVGGEEYHALAVGDWTNAQVIRPFTGEYILGMMAFSPDGRLLARFKTSTSYELVEVSTWRSLGVLQSPYPIGLGWPRFSRDGTLLAAADTALGVQVWDLRELRAALRPLGLDWDHPPYSDAPSTTNHSSIVARVLSQ